MAETLDFIGGAEGIRTPDLLNAIKIQGQHKILILVLSVLFRLICCQELKIHFWFVLGCFGILCSHFVHN